MSGTEIQKQDWEGVGIVPPRRLGALLSAARSDRRLTLEEIVERSEGAFTIAALASVERGTTYVTDDELQWIADLYGVETANLVPSRSKLVIDLDDGTLEVGDRRAVRLGREAGRQEVLARYLATVYSMRAIEPGTPITLRVDDLDVLGQALDLRPSDAASDLEALMADPDQLVTSRHGTLARRLLVPAAGVLIALVGIGSLVMVDGDGSPSATSVRPTTTAAVAQAAPPSAVKTSVAAGIVRIGQAVVQERLADGTPGPETVRED